MDWNSTKKHSRVGFRGYIKIPVKGDIIKDGIKLPTEHLTLVGTLDFDFITNTLSGNLGMAGTWRRAFGVPNFAMANIVLG